ncbi:phosphatidylinositol alpha-1,6-mannosyltransferase [Rubricella aquisinus]|uniref:Phosphatidylinositol alpha-1,6-mannosyltransferase n=1 Tax=Rubricella aquisinus TaxID=2028108 RepID=A0A840WJU9_9RHOB|nr:glycosyltransferase family 4 protein [Rubricella aquisinus]MBB5514453.1 phosphatidylinositol alpha-1,6-mannosyltransferase [Rubricella aquisinus]
MIAITAQAFPPASGGIQNLMAGLAEHIAKAGHDTLVFADGKPDAQDARLPYKIRRFAGLKPLRRVLKARAIKATPGITALYADSWKSLERLPNRLPYPVIVYAHGNEYPEDGRKAARIRAALSKATHMIVVSEETRGRSAPMVPSGLPVTTIHPPVYPHTPATETDHARIAEMWPSSGPRLVTLSRLIDWKGIDQAIRAVAAVRAAHPGLQMLIGGTGDDLDRLQGIVAEHDLADVVKFIGRIEGGAKTALLESADIFLQPGRSVNGQREGFGITYLEAALAGLPTISGNAGGAPEALRHGETGFVVDGTDLSEVTNALSQLLTNEALRHQMGAAGRAHGQAALWQNQIGDILKLAAPMES